MGTNLTRFMTILMKLLPEFIIWKMGENENMCNLYLSHYFIILFIFFFNEILPELCWRSFSNSPYLRAKTSDTVCLGYVINTREIYSLTYLFFHLYNKPHCFSKGFFFSILKTQAPAIMTMNFHALGNLDLFYSVNHLIF